MFARMNEFQKICNIIFDHKIYDVSYLIICIRNKRWPNAYVLLKMYNNNSIIRKDIF